MLALPPLHDLLLGVWDPLYPGLEGRRVSLGRESQDRVPLSGCVHPDCPGTLPGFSGTKNWLGLWPQGGKLRHGQEELALVLLERGYLRSLLPLWGEWQRLGRSDASVWCIKVPVLISSGVELYSRQSLLFSQLILLAVPYSSVLY